MNEETVRAAFELRGMTSHEIGTWPAYRDGYAAGQAARTPGPGTAKLLRAVLRAIEGTDGTDIDQIELRSDNCSAWISVGDARAAIAEREEAVRSPHPDTVRLDWLESLSIDVGYLMLDQGRCRAVVVPSVIRTAIDTTMMRLAARSECTDSQVGT
jgi:hypothetical protein